MSGAVIDWDLVKVEGAYALKTGDIDTVLPRVRTTLVVRVDAAARAKKMLCGVGVELVNAEQFCSLSDVDAVQVCGHRNGAAHATERTGTAPHRTESVSQLCSEPHGTAMTGAIGKVCGGIHAQLSSTRSDSLYDQGLPAYYTVILSATVLPGSLLRSC